MMVIAGPGSGKTFVITRRIEYLINQYKVDPSHILVITFTKAAALEMQHRFLKLLNGRFAPVNFGTFHAIFYTILKETFHYSSQNIISEKEKKNILKNIIASRNSKLLLQDEMLDILISEFSYIKNTEYDLEKFHSTILTNDMFILFFEEYQKMLRTLDKFDFDDMVIRCQELLVEKPDILVKYQNQFKYILIDEFQDINKKQFEIIKMLAFPHNNLFVVGDDDQAIYGFRGSDPGIMLSFKEIYEDTEIVTLNVNYRCSGNILNCALHVIEKNINRFQKQLMANNPPGDEVEEQACADKEEQYDYIVQQIKKYIGELKIKPADIAIITRTNTEFSVINSILQENEIDTNYKEHQNRWDTEVLHDLVALYRFATGEHLGEHFIRFMNKPVRYIERDAVSESIDLAQLIQYYSGNRLVINNLLRLKNDLNKVARYSPAVGINYICKAMGYELYISEKKDINKIKTLRFVRQESVKYKCVHDFVDFLENANINGRQNGMHTEEKTDGVQLLTMHGSKGLEFDIVFLPNANEGTIPHRKAKTISDIEEERRMFYVAMTRAKKILCITYLTGTEEHMVYKTRFLECQNSE